jgi:hypothetical protein
VENQSGISSGSGFDWKEPDVSNLKLVTIVIAMAAKVTPNFAHERAVLSVIKISLGSLPVLLIIRFVSRRKFLILFIFVHIRGESSCVRAIFWIAGVYSCNKVKVWILIQ